jgi:ABC-type multidrug transport system ATPase subunit
MFKAENISFQFPNGKKVFRKLNFTLKEGEILSIVGPSGAGKSTLLNCISAKLQLGSGSIYLDNERIKGPKEQLLKGNSEIAIIDQAFDHDVFFTVEENISGQLHHLSQDERLKFVEELLAVFHLEDLKGQKSGELSGGEKQRLSMACALAKEPKLLLLDEPFVHMDVHLLRSIGQYIRKLTKLRSMMVILVTHQGEDALSWSDKISFFKSGKIKSKYTPERAYNKPKTLYEGLFFGELNSIYLEGKQYLFRPHNYSLKAKKETEPINIDFEYSEFRGHYFANYFKMDNNKSLVLYANHELSTQKVVYVSKN